jgi:hypothetical protein
MKGKMKKTGSASMAKHDEKRGAIIIPLPHAGNERRSARIIQVGTGFNALTAIHQNPVSHIDNQQVVH